VMMLRLQRERMSGASCLRPRNISATSASTRKKLAYAKPGAFVMHSSADGPRRRIAFADRDGAQSTDPRNSDGVAVAWRCCERWTPPSGRTMSEGARLSVGELFRVEAEVAEIFLGRRHEGAAHALALQAQHHHDVGVLQPRLHVAKNLDAHVSMPGGSSVDGPTTRTRAASVPRAKMLERADARMQDVAADGDIEPLDAARLRRMVSASSSAWVGCSCAPSRR